MVGGGEGKKMQRGGECGLLETASGVFVMQAAAGAQKCFAEGEDMSSFSSDVVKKDQDHKKSMKPGLYQIIRHPIYNGIVCLL